MVFSDSFLCKVLDNFTDWIARPYSSLEGVIPLLFQFLTNETVSCYRDVPWSEEELSFIACTFTSIFKRTFKMILKPKPTILIDFPANLVLTKVYWGIFLLALPTVVVSLAFKSNNFIKVVMSGSEVPFTSFSRAGLPSPKFKAWWASIRERVRNFGESGAQCVDIPPIFQGDLTLKLSAKAKPLAIKGK